MAVHLAVRAQLPQETRHLSANPLKVIPPFQGITYQKVSQFRKGSD